MSYLPSIASQSVAMSTTVGFGVVTNVVQYLSGPINITNAGVTHWTVYAPSGSTWKTRLSVDAAVGGGDTLTLQCLYAPTINGVYVNQGSAITRTSSDGTAVVESATLTPSAGYLKVSVVYSGISLAAQVHIELLRLS